jgi:hypothetical protein
MENSSIIAKIKKIITILTPLQIKAGYGVTTDSNVSVPKKIAEEPINFTHNLVKKYTTKGNAGLFEIDSQIRGENGRVIYLLVHCQTGQRFHLTKSLFEILFQPSYD